MASELDRETGLLLLAIRYVSGELGPDDEAAFELRLDDDQDAREAVAEAVALAGAIAALHPEEGAVLPMTRRRPSRQIWSVLGLAAAAGLAGLIILLPGKATPPDRARADAVTGKSNPSPTVTLAWSTLQQDRDGEPDEATELLAWNDDLPPAGLIDADAEAGDSLPLWLLDAASLGVRPGARSTSSREN